MPSLERNDDGDRYVTIPKSPELQVIATSVHRVEVKEGIVANLLIVKSKDAVPSVREVHLVAAPGKSIRHADLASISHGEIEDALDASMQIQVSVSFGEGRLPIRRPKDVNLHAGLTSAGRERKRTDITDDFLRGIADMVNLRNMSPKEIAKELGKSRQTGYRWVQQAREAGLVVNES